MKIRHAVTLALMGWYLMMPPQGSGVVPPISKWRHAGVFENADECATARNLILSACRQDLDDVRGEKSALPPGTVANDIEESGWSTLNNLMKTTMSRCIATDDPRLAGGNSSEHGRPPEGSR